MTALPSNLALVGEDLARATFLDARRSRRRRRLATYTIAFALLAATATAAVASGWLFGGETPVVRVVPSLAGTGLPATVAPGNGTKKAIDVTQGEAQHRATHASADGSAPLGQATNAPARTLLTGLGSANRVLTSVATTSGGVCLMLTGFGTQCVPTFAAGDHIDWLLRTTQAGLSVVWGIVSADVTAVVAISADGTSVPAEIGNGGFYLEMSGAPPEKLIAHISDGSTQSVQLLPCPPTTPDCSP